MNSNDRPVALFLVDDFKRGERDVLVHRLAYAGGFRPFIAPWFRIAVGEHGTYIADAIEALAADGARPIPTWENVTPAAIFHACNLSPRATEIYARIAERHSEAVLSFTQPLLERTLRLKSPQPQYAIGTLQPLKYELFGACGDAGQSALAHWRDLPRLRSLPALTRLFVFASLDAGARASLLPIAGSSLTNDVAEAAMARYFELVAERVRQAPPVSWPAPAFQCAPAPPPVVDGDTLRDAARVLSDYERRDTFAARAASAQKPVRLTLDGVECDTVLSMDGRRPCIDLVAAVDADLDAISHPMLRVLPSVDGERGILDTAPWQGATLQWADPHLVAPQLGALSRDETILRYLGRVTTSHPPPDNMGQRFVEPGVGRSALVDFIRVAGRPDLHDFTVTGIGLTPYSERGFVALGVEINGRAALVRARHRRRCAERLEEAGVRAAPVVAIIELTGDPIAMPDGSHSPPALVVRGFRSVLRIKQLDPVAPFFHSVEHAATLLPFLQDRRWDTPPENGGDEIGAYAHLRYGAVAGDLRDITAPGPEAPDAFATARARRRQLISSFAPHVIGLARARLAQELGGDELTGREYVLWFAATFGRQLAAMRRLRFLHDYHHPGTSRNSPGWVYTLVENNVTLLAELADLDTAVFLDGSEPEILDEIQLTRADIRVLNDNFAACHLRDLGAARAITTTLARVATHGDEVIVSEALAKFENAYDEGVRS